MKTSKQIKILAGVTRVRIQLGMTQEMLALYIGVSKSLVSMVENGNRQLPVSALKIIHDLEKALQHPAEAAPATPIKKEVAATPLDSWQQAQLNIKQLRLKELQYEYNRMASRYEQLAKSSGHIRHLLSMPGHKASSRATRLLVFQLGKLCDKMQTCNDAARTRKQWQMALLEQLIKGAQQTQGPVKSNQQIMSGPHLSTLAA